ncbi:MAG: hypothetical protein MJY44_04980, partial [Bacteroidales bacterium]|nr:hypothetical protein [Bacteroidales bacterium]
RNLSLATGAVVNVSVKAQSSLTGYSEFSSDEVLVTAQCAASGFNLIKLEHASKTVVVYFEPDELEALGDGIFRADRQTILSKTADIFGDGVTVISLIGDDIRFRFASEHFKKVPVSPVRVCHFRPQYIESSEMLCIPDSVVVYAEPQMLETIEDVKTALIFKSDVHRSLRGVIALECPEGARLGTGKVNYEMQVSRYVEIPATVSVGVRNIPQDRSLIVFPPEVKVVYRCVFPLLGDPVDGLQFYVDYEDYRNSLTGLCVVKSSGSVSGLIDYRVEPLACDCVERVVQ